ncbi:hypothetical protein B566_EDAN015171 [Ephemera danica]|nr:hypothetical protein B566_EDAN015171 [Ephemera danica]
MHNNRSSMSVIQQCMAPKWLLQHRATFVVWHCLILALLLSEGERPGKKLKKGGGNSSTDFWGWCEQCDQFAYVTPMLHNQSHCPYEEFSFSLHRRNGFVVELKFNCYNLPNTQQNKWEPDVPENTYIWHLLQIRRYARNTTLEEKSREWKYDAFVSYNYSDRQWVHDQLINNLENNEENYALCLHERDFQLGRYIMENVAECMESSRHVIAILSPNFVQSNKSRDWKYDAFVSYNHTDRQWVHDQLLSNLESDEEKYALSLHERDFQLGRYIMQNWCQWELKLVQQLMFENTADFLILVELERLDRKTLPSTLRLLMSTKTYLEWPTEGNLVHFWRRLKNTLGPPLAITHPKLCDDKSPLACSDSEENLLACNQVNGD